MLGVYLWGLIPGAFIALGAVWSINVLFDMEEMRFPFLWKTGVWAVSVVLWPLVLALLTYLFVPEMVFLLAQRENRT